MSNVWSEFDNSIDAEQLQKDIANVKSNEFPEVPEGIYTVKVDTMSPGKSKNGNPMCSIRFRITEGRFKNACLFYNQTVNNAYGLHNNNEFLKSMELNCIDSLGDKIFKNMTQYADLIMDAAEEITTDNLQFSLYYPGKDHWPNEWKIKEVYEG